MYKYNYIKIELFNMNNILCTKYIYKINNMN